MRPRHKRSQQRQGKGYAYNQAGELTSITYPSGRAVQQSYDAIGRLSSIASGATTYANGFAYNPAFQPTSLSYGNGVTASFSYSPDRLQLQSLSHTRPGQTLFGLTYGYSQNGGNDGQITSITDSVDAGRNVTYTYDALARLSTAVTQGSVPYPKWGLSWTYDRYGNRTAQTVTAGTGPSNSVTVSATTNRITDPGYSYDPNGNMTADGLNALTYDAENRIVTSSGTNYSSDGNNLRVKKVSGGATTVYIFSGSKVIAEYVNGTLSKEYVYSGSALVAKIEGATTTYYHGDHLSLRASSDGTVGSPTFGQKIGDQGHYPYGESWYLQNTTTKWQFTTYERDGESGNDYAMARTYLNRLGRFSSPDLVAGSPSDPQSLNRYSYVRNDPCNLVDPLGLCGDNPLTGKPGLEGTRVTSGFGPRTNPITKQPQDPHRGTDFAAAVGTPLYPILPGRIVRTNITPKGGFSITVQVGGTDWYYQYFHLSAAVVLPAEVSSGNIIASSGNTGQVTGPHLHVQILNPEGKKVNPVKFLEDPCPAAIENAINQLAGGGTGNVRESPFYHVLFWNFRYREGSFLYTGIYFTAFLPSFVPVPKPAKYF